MENEEKNTENEFKTEGEVVTEGEGEGKVVFLHARPETRHQATVSKDWPERQGKLIALRTIPWKPTAEKMQKAGYSAEQAEKESIVIFKVEGSEDQFLTMAGVIAGAGAKAKIDPFDEEAEKVKIKDNLFISTGPNKLEIISA